MWSCVATSGITLIIRDNEQNQQGDIIGPREHSVRKHHLGRVDTDDNEVHDPIGAEPKDQTREYNKAGLSLPSIGSYHREDANTGNHDQPFKQPTDSPGKRYEVLIVGHSRHQVVSRQGMKRIHHPSTKQRHPDNKGSGIACARNMDVCQDDRKKRNAKGTPLEDGVSHAPPQNLMQCIDHGASGLCREREGVKRRWL
jgi:hypothetical protein